MTDTKPPEIKQRFAMSVWSVQGCPQNPEGLVGAHRGMLFLLPLTAEVPDAIERFIKECREHDRADYDRAKCETAHYIGWLWLPEKEEAGWMLPSLLADIDKVKEAARYVVKEEKS
jgi:hypothetical protein